MGRGGPLRVLSWIAALGAAAGALLIVLLVVAALHRPTHRAAVATVVPRRGTATPTTGPLATPQLSARQRRLDRCKRQGRRCEMVILDQINVTRAARGISPLRLNPRQQRGSAGCVGSRGHSRAMAQSGHVWHTDPHYPHASFPQNICVPVQRRYEVIAMAPGPQWQAVGLLEYSILHRIKPKRQLLSGRYREAGIALAHARGRYYLTVDLLG